MPSIRQFVDGFRERLERRAQRKILQSYLTRLPLLLAQDYGALGPYTPPQIRRSMERHKLTIDSYFPYALAIFCDRDDIEGILGPTDYDQLRAEVAADFFNGDVDFKVRAVRGQNSSWENPSEPSSGITGAGGSGGSWGGTG